jgi:hypothetical protein
MGTADKELEQNAAIIDKLIDDIVKLAEPFPVPIVLDALENVYIMGLQSIGPRETELFIKHLQAFHNEFLIMQSEKPTEIPPTVN